MLYRSASLAIITLVFSVAACSSPDAPNSSDTPNSSAPDMSSSIVDMTSALDMKTSDNQDEPDLRATIEPDLSDDEPDMRLEPAALEIPEKPWDPTINGPYNMGFGSSELTYPIAPDDADRTFEFVWWHPTRAPTGKRTRYVRNTYPTPSRNVFKDVPLPDEPAKFPVLIFSHGNSSFGEQSYFMTERFASHGWIVLAPYHTENTFFDNVGAINLYSAFQRPQDIHALIDWLEDIPEDHPLHGRVDLDRIGMSGHSFGAFTTLAVAGSGFAVDEIEVECEQGVIDDDYCTLFSPENRGLFRRGFEDTRIKAAAPHTPGIGQVFREGTSQIEIPTLIMTAGRDRSLPEAENGDPIWENMSGPHARFTFPNGGHFTYSNMCEFLGTIEIAAEDGCNDTFIPYQDALPMINHYTLAWMEYHINGATELEPLINGEERPYPAEDLIYTLKEGATN